jgi:nitrite reductase/ring-hydroxylating ferredoxin subunit
MAEFLDAADVSSLPPGRGRSVELRGKRLALFNLEGTFHAIDDQCPHRGAPLGSGWCENGEVFCPLHGWAFDIATGACKTRPDRPVQTYPTQVRDGKVWIGVD